MKNGTLRTALIIAAVIALMIGLNLLLYVKPDPPAEDEFSGDRSSYSGRAYGTLGYYTFLEESNFPVGRWRKPYTELRTAPSVRTLFIIAPPAQYNPTQKEMIALKNWIANGGAVIIFDREIQLDFGKQILRTESALPSLEDKNSSIFENGVAHAAVPLQPVPLFRNVKRLAVSEFARTIELLPGIPRSNSLDAADANDPPPEADRQDTGLLDLAGAEGKSLFAEIRYGKGRILCVTDPYVIANNGIRQEDNATFGLNLAAETLNGAEHGDGTLMFDEYHHGYHDSGKGLLGVLSYFRGTPTPWMALHLAACGALILYTFGRRFARPLPIKKRNRASSLEFVTAMAQIQRVAESYDLAIENFYIRFHRLLCRYGGVPPTATLKIVADAVAKRSGKNASEIRALIERCAEIINGKETTEREMLKLARAMRQMETELQLDRSSQS